ncbi:thiamine pyrophosphate-dependent enzyme [Burkholderia stagnalis]|uniref:thiamine pyrophosphate-dependent enzyme n=1 Tax=Burkholderia stagnalis TaxID=1503054 RepID=UPI0009C12A9F|nr:thiamine pyrophosphate-dependent enzyme [Burkholderia stagnalis]
MPENIMLNGLLERRWVVSTLLESRENLLVISGLGSAVWDITAAGDHPLNFPVWGAMGAASTVGLGLALAQPDRPVLVVTGDGEMLMQLGALATIGVQQPRNLSIAVLDNECYGETGRQRTHTASGIDLAGVARACGIERASVIRSPQDVTDFRYKVHARTGPLFSQIKIAANKPALVMPPRDGSYLKDRFRTALLGDIALD